MKKIISLTIIILFSTIIFAQSKSAGFYLKRAYNRTLSSQDFEGALRDYNKAIEIKPENSVAYISRGTLKFLHLHDYKGAIEDFDKAIELNPLDTIALQNRARLKSELRDYAGAMQDYSKIIELNPGSGKSYHARGRIKFFYMNDKSSACDDWKKADELGIADIKELLEKYCK